MQKCPSEVVYVMRAPEAVRTLRKRRKSFPLNILPPSVLRRAVTTFVLREWRWFVVPTLETPQHAVSRMLVSVIFPTVPIGMSVALYRCAPGALGKCGYSSPGIRVSKTGIAFRRNLMRLDARNDMQTDYRQASSEFHVRAEAIAEQLILWGVIATLIFLAVTMIRAT